jgi:hypothetical protein
MDNGVRSKGSMGRPTLGRGEQDRRTRSILSVLMMCELLHTAPSARLIICLTRSGAPVSGSIAGITA